MVNLVNLAGIVIPSGSSREELRKGDASEDLGRLSAGVYVNPGDVPYLVAGIGPDLNRCSFDDKGYIVDDRGGDVHTQLYNNLVANYDAGLKAGKLKFFSVEPSMNSSENLRASFPPGLTGKYLVVTTPIQIKRFQLLAKKFRSMGKISRDVEIVYFPTKRWRDLSTQELIHSGLGLVKDILFRW